MLSRTNIEDQLRKVRNKATTSEDVLKEVYAILAEDNKREDAIIARMKSPQKPTPRNQFDIDLLDADRIYHVDQIRKICVDYRLRFLDTKYFKKRFLKKLLMKSSN